MQQNEDTPWKYKADDGTKPGGEAAAVATSSEAPPETAHSPKNVAWESAEFIEHQRGPGWYILLIIATVLLAAVAYLVAKDIFATVVIVIVGGIVWAYAGQKPGLARYEITSSGLSINGKPYSFSNYKSFTIIRESGLSSINLFPLKRLTPPLSAYFDPKDEQKIVQAIGDYVPYENRKLDQVDRLARRLRL